MSEKIAYVCNAGCLKRNSTSDSEFDSVKTTLVEKGYDVRTKGCLKICELSKSLGVVTLVTDIVNVELHDGSGGIKQSIASMDGESIGVRTIKKTEKL